MNFFFQKIEKVNLNGRLSKTDRVKKRLDKALEKHREISY